MKNNKDNEYKKLYSLLKQETKKANQRIAKIEAVYR